MFCEQTKTHFPSVRRSTRGIDSPDAAETYLNNAYQDPESILFGRMSQQKRRDKVVHALTVCRCVQTDGRVSSGSFSVAAAKEAGHKPYSRLLDRA